MHMLFLARRIVIFLLFGKIRNFRMHWLHFPDFTASITWIFNILAKCWWWWNVATNIVTQKQKRSTASIFFFILLMKFWFSKRVRYLVHHVVERFWAFFSYQLQYQIKYGEIKRDHKLGDVFVWERFSKYLKHKMVHHVVLLYHITLYTTLHFGCT